MLYPGHSQAGLLSQVFVYKIVLPGTENLIWRATEENARNENIRIEDNFHDFPRALATALVISAFSSQNQPKLLYYYPSPQAVVGVDLCQDSDLAQGDR
jgi:phage FluMu gp28-like protein